jgi:1-acyl-sn-glycerol-3-phosphate acyltransferase
MQSPFSREAEHLSRPDPRMVHHAAGFVPVDRGDAARSVSTVDTALKRLRSGKIAGRVPGGARTLDRELAPFKKGPPCWP